MSRSARVRAAAAAPAASAAAPQAFRLEASAVRFEVGAKAADGAPKLPTFAINGYTGAVMRLEGFYSPVVIDLAGVKSPSQEIPILRDHDMGRIVGQTDSVKVDASGVTLTGTITGENEDAREVISQAKNGFRWKASIGASVDRREFLDAGKSATVNGREVTGPLVLVRESTLGETSFVAIGADNSTSAGVAARRAAGLHSGDTDVFETWVQARGFEPSGLSETQATFLRALFDADTPPAAPPRPGPAAPPDAPASLEAILKAHRDEDARRAEIARLTDQAIQRRPALLDRIEEVSRHAVAAKCPLQEFELTLLRVERDASAAPAGFGRRGDEPPQQAVIEAALCRAGRLGDLERHFDARTLEAADRHFRYGIGLQELLLIGARERGYTGNSVHNTGALLRAAFPPLEVRAEGFANINIPGTLSNVMNKFLVDYFMSVEDAWRKICAIRNARDFKQISIYSLTGDLQYEQVGPTGELKSGTVGEAKYTNQVSTFGRILAITRTDIVNDDLSALMRIPQRLGRGGALKINDVVWSTFLAGVGTFWAAGNNNLITGAGSALSAAGLQAGLVAFRKQTDPDGKPLGLSPAVLLTPPELEVTGDQLMSSQNFNTGGASTIAQVPNRNTWQGAYTHATSAYLSNTTYTGNSATAWFLLADPNDLPTIELAVLNGREVPIIESAEAHFDQLGIMVRGYHDFGATLLEPRGSVRAAGV